MFIFAIIVDLTFHTNNCNAQWVQTSSPNGGTINALAVSGTNLLTGTHTGGILKTSNNGDNWNSINNGLTNLNVTSLAVSGSYIFAGTYGGGVFLSTNAGSNWVAINNGLSNKYVNTFLVSDANIFAGTLIGVFLSTDNGSSWSLQNNGLSNISVISFTVLGANIYAGTFSGGIFLSTNKGESWSAKNNGLTNQFVYSLASSGTNLFAGTWDGGVFKSSNSGENWSAINSGLTNRYIMALSVSGINLFAATLNGIFLSTNIGTNWIPKNQGINPMQGFYCFAIKDNFIFSGAQYGYVWKRSLSEIITIRNIGTEVPSSFSLSQNYPNPFNSSTLIKFAVPKSSFISIKVFDLLGKEISVLVNESLNPGIYTVDWNAGEFSSGVYFFRLQLDNFVETRKMLLNK